MKNNERGITLIALIVTVIVLLILAGVSISYLIGDNGIIKKAVIAVQKYNQAQEEENNALNRLGQFDGRPNGNGNGNNEYSYDGIGLVKGQLVEPGKYFKRENYSIRNIPENGAEVDSAGTNICIKMYAQLTTLINNGMNMDYARQYADYAKYATGKISRNESIMKEYYNNSDTSQKEVTLASNKSVRTNANKIFELAKNDSIEMAEEQAIFNDRGNEKYILKTGYNFGNELGYTDKSGNEKSVKLLNVPNIVENGLKNLSTNYNENQFLLGNAKSQMDGAVDRLIILQEYNTKTIENIKTCYNRILDDIEEALEKKQNGQGVLSSNSLSGYDYTVEKLATINRAGDDAAGLAISEKMSSQLRGLKMAESNIEDGISLIHTADDSIKTILLAVRKQQEYFNEANSLYGQPDSLEKTNKLKNLEDNINQMQEVISYIANSASFNSIKLIDGTYVNRNLQIGANATSKFEISFSDFTLEGLNLAGISISTIDSVQNGLTNLKSAEEKINNECIKIQGMLDRLEIIYANNAKMIENTEKASENIIDTDIADEMRDTDMLSYNQLSQSGNIIKLAQSRGLTQANANAQDGISLLNFADDALTVLETAINKEKEYLDMAKKLYEQPDSTERTDTLNVIDYNVKEMIKTIDYIVNVTEFNKMKVIDGSCSNITLQIGPNVGDSINIQIGDYKSTSLNINDITVLTQNDIETSRTKLDNANNKISNEHTNIAGKRSQLESALQSAQT